jgi:hypothetical protein
LRTAKTKKKMAAATTREKQPNAATAERRKERLTVEMIVFRPAAVRGWCFRPVTVRAARRRRAVREGEESSSSGMGVGSREGGNKRGREKRRLYILRAMVFPNPFGLRF